jgi:hypothetical protein
VPPEIPWRKNPAKGLRGAGCFRPRFCKIQYEYGSSGLREGGPQRERNSQNLFNFLKIITIMKIREAEISI